MSVTLLCLIDPKRLFSFTSVDSYDQHYAASAAAVVVKFFVRRLPLNQELRDSKEECERLLSELETLRKLVEEEQQGGAIGSLRAQVLPRPIIRGNVAGCC